LFILIPCIAITGGTGFLLAANRTSATAVPLKDLKEA